MTMKKFLLIALAIILAGGLLFGCAEPAPAPTPAPTPTPAPAPAPVEPIKIRFTSTNSPEMTMGANEERFCRQVEELSETPVEITIHWGGVVASSMEAADAVAGGVCEMGRMVAAYFPQRWPLWTISSGGIPFMYRNEPIACWNAFETLRKEFPEFDEEMLSNNLKVIAEIQGLDPVGIVSKNPIRTVDDLKGIKVRAPGGWAPQMFEAAGAVPVSMPAPEVFDALDKGVVEATQGGVSTNLQFKLYEVCGYHTINAAFETNCAPMVFIMNVDTWNSLPEDVKSAILEVGSQEIENWGALMKQDFVEGIAFLEEQGVEVIPFPEESITRWKEMTDKKDLPSKWVDQVVESGIPKEIAEAVKNRWIELEPGMIEKYGIDW